MKPSAVITVALLLARGSGLLAGPLEIADVDEVYPEVPYWPKARILHIGDSHVSFGFKRALARRFREAGATFKQKSWKGSRTKSWVASGKARRLIAEFQPTVVVVTLGTNEMKYDKPERQLSWIRALVDRIGARMCYWLGPPPLIEDRRGYNDFVSHNVAPCRYFDSRVLEVGRRSDGRFHLTRAEGEAWAAMVWRWMNGS
jgi:hypothetical protein